jgi:hypothetical protein
MRLRAGGRFERVGIFGLSRGRPDWPLGGYFLLFPRARPPRPRSISRDRSSSAARISSLGRVVRYSAARILFGNPSSAYLATPDRRSVQRIRPTGGFSSGWVQCSRGEQGPLVELGADLAVELPDVPPASQGLGFVEGARLGFLTESRLT